MRVFKVTRELGVFFSKRLIRMGLSSLLTFVHLSNLGCIHTQSHERAAIEIPESQGIEMQAIANLEIGSIVYRPSKLPLSDFFARLSRGEFKEAFQKIDLDYKQSNANDRAMIELIEHGYIPVYVQIRNLGSSSVSFDEKNFSLVSDGNQVKAFYSDQLPYEFKSFSPKAVAANVYNVGLVVIGFVAVVAAMAIVAGASHGGTPGWPDSGLDGLKDMRAINDTDRTTTIEYKHYLIHASQVNPQGTTSGLLFFKVDNLAGIHNYKLIFNMK